MIPNLTSGFKNSPNWVFYAQTVGLVFGTSLLSYLLYRISASMATSNVDADGFGGSTNEHYTSTINEVD